jgi:hypothetical protein
MTLSLVCHAESFDSLLRTGSVRDLGPKESPACAALCDRAENYEGWRRNCLEALLHLLGRDFLSVQSAPCAKSFARSSGPIITGLKPASRTKVDATASASLSSPAAIENTTTKDVIWESNLVIAGLLLQQIFSLLYLWHESCSYGVCRTAIGR